MHPLKTRVAKLSLIQARLAGLNAPLEFVPMVRGLLCVALLLVTAAAHADTWPDKEWAKGAPLEGPAVDALNAYAFPPRDDATRKGIRTDALLVIRDGVIIYERYAAPTTADTPHLTWSVSKSLMATVLGVAYGEHRFKLSDPAARFYPPMKQHPKVTLADLLHRPCRRPNCKTPHCRW